MLVIALVLVLVAAGCAVLVSEASRDLLPGPAVQLLTHSATPAEAAAPVVPTQRTATDSARAAATYGFIAELPSDTNAAVRVNL